MRSPRRASARRIRVIGRLLLSLAAPVALLAPAAIGPARAGDEPQPAAAERPAGQEAASSGETVAAAAPSAPQAPAPQAPSTPQETVTVREPADRLRADPTAFGTVIESAQWADRITTLPELLRGVVGVQVKSIGDTLSTVSIRGSTAEQVMVYLDGVPLNRAAGGAVNLADIPLAQVERIEVYRGMTPASLPEASIGGAIVITTRGPKGPAAGDGWVSAGSYRSAEVSASCGEEKARGGWRVAADGAGSDGDFPYLDPNGTPDDPTDDEVTPRVNNDFRRGHALARGHWRAGETAFGVELDAFRREQGVPGLDAVQSPNSRLETSRVLLSATAERAGLASGRLVVRGALAWHDEREQFDGDGSGVFGQDSDNDLASTSLSGGGTLVAGTRHALNFLVSYRDEKADLRDPSPGGGDVGLATRQVAGVTLEDQVVLAAGRLQIVPSLRHEATASNFEPGPAAGVVAEDSDTSVTTGRLGVKAELAPAWSLRANAGTYQRIPDFTEMFGMTGSVRGNPGLVPEQGTNADLGLAWEATRPLGAFHGLRVEGVLFGTDADDLIVYRQTSFGILVAENVSAARIRGVELSVQTGLGPHLSGALNVVRQEAIETGDSFRNGFPLPGRSNVEASTTLGGRFGRTRLDWNFTYVGPNNVSTVANPDTELPARYLHDVSCRVLLPHRLEATVQVHNLFDDHTVDLYRYPLPGRRYEARLAWAF